MGKCGGVVKSRDWRKSKDSRSGGKPKGLRKLKTEEEGRKERNGDVYKRGPCDAKVKKYCNLFGPPIYVGSFHQQAIWDSCAVAYPRMGCFESRTSEILVSKRKRQHFFFRFSGFFQQIVWSFLLCFLNSCSNFVGRLFYLPV